jgi:hypothetical protein
MTFVAKPESHEHDDSKIRMPAQKRAQTNSIVNKIRCTRIMATLYTFGDELNGR